MFLGIDLGTSEVKLLLLDERHRIVATAGRPLTISRPAPLHSEQDPSAWWRATEAAAAQLRAEQPQAWAAVQALGLSGQMHGAVLLDAAGAVLRPAILWNDGRSGAECAAMEAAEPCLHGLAGNLAMPGFTAPKLLWLQRHEPAVFERVATVLLPKDWLRFQLSGGERVGDMSDASGTLWLDVERRAWSEPLLRAGAMRPDQMPRLVEGSEVASRLDPKVAAAWGLRAGIPIAGGGGDNAASAVGMGVVEPGDAFVSLGTSGVIFVAADRHLANPPSAVHAFCHALPQRWHQMSVMLSAASALAWARGLTGRDEAWMGEAAAALPAAERARAPLFLPYLAGERTPLNDPLAQAELHGLRAAHGPADIAQAVFEGVTFGLMDGWDAISAPLRERVVTLSAVGGGARSAWWLKLLAAALDRPIELREGGETGGALGAARLAWVATGAGVAQVCAPGAVRSAQAPDAALREQLLARRARWLRLRDSVQGLWA